MISRRALLLSGTAAILAALPRLGQAQQAVARAAFVVLDMRNQDVSAGTASTVLTSFISSGIAVSVLLPALDGAQDASAVHSAVAQAALAAPRLADLAIHTTASDSTRRYAQLRLAVDARRTALDLFGSPDIVPSAVWFDSNSDSERIDSNVLRAAGFRAAFQIPGAGSDDSTVDSPDWGQLSLSGGRVALLSDDPAPVLAAAAAAETDQIITLRITASTAPDDAARWVMAIQDAFWQGQLLTTHPSDYLLQSNPGASKLVGLVVWQGVTSVAQEQVAAFTAELDAQSLPYTVVSGTPGALCWMQTPQEANCGTLPAGLVDGTPPIMLHQADEATGWMGPDETATIHVSTSQATAARFLSRIEVDPLSDEILQVRPEEIDTQLKRQTILTQLIAARRDGLAHFRGLPGFVSDLYSPDPIVARYWQHRLSPIPRPDTPAVMTESETSQLRDDAAWAWKYFTQTADRQSGIAAATRQAGPVETLDRFVTFWDIGSQLFGTSAAVELGLLSATQAQDWLGDMLETLPSINIDGLILPPASFNGDTRQIQIAGFDSCDVGRFLMALNHIVDAGLISREAANARIGKWDLQATIREGRPFSYVDGKWQDKSASHCTGYSQQGFGAWGFAIDGVLPTIPDNPTADDLMAVMSKADEIGHYGAEPYLLEAVEGVFSPQGRYLMDILLSAQQNWHAQTGTYKCVSEAPLAFAPWFSFQGLRPNRLGNDAWVISAPGDANAFDKANFRETSALISAKAAYLWAAAYGDPYSKEVLELIQTRGRADQGGFTVGLFESDLSQMYGYSDINTNGIILTAIAYLLRNR